MTHKTTAGVVCFFKDDGHTTNGQPLTHDEQESGIMEARILKLESMVDQIQAEMTHLEKLVPTIQGETAQLKLGITEIKSQMDFELSTANTRIASEFTAIHKKLSDLKTELSSDDSKLSIKINSLIRDANTTNYRMMLVVFVAILGLLFLNIFPVLFLYGLTQLTRQEPKNPKTHNPHS